MGDSLFGAASRLRTFMALTSTLKSVGRLTLSAERRWHAPSAPHSVTAIAAHIRGADPSYLPAAAAGNGARDMATTPRTAPRDANAFIASLPSTLSTGQAFIELCSHARPCRR